MPKHEPGVYEPSSDDIRVFDGGEDDLDEEGSRLPLLIVIALLVLAAFVGVVWLAYTQGVQSGRESAPRTIPAEQGPVRTAPENPGGKTPYAGLKIYEQSAPPAEQGAPARSAAAPSQKKAATRHAAKPARKAPVVKHTVTHRAEALPKGAASALAKAAPVKRAALKPASAAGGGYTLQIGSYKSEAEAAKAWAVYQRKHPLVGGFTPDIRKADLGAKGVWYRLRIGSFASRASAGKLCAKLKADHGGCFPTKR
jgi:cell division protein FtsN